MNKENECDPFPPKFSQVFPKVPQSSFS